MCVDFPETEGEDHAGLRESLGEGALAASAPSSSYLRVTAIHCSHSRARSNAGK